MARKYARRWYVTADAGRAFAYTRRKASTGYEQIATWTSQLVLPADERPHFADKPGRIFEGGNRRHSAETTSRTKLAGLAFARDLAETLNRARLDGQFEELVIYAAPRVLHVLRRNLDKATAASLLHHEAKDITKYPARDLFDVFDRVGLASPVSS